MTKCHDCDVEEGEAHKTGCDMERCPRCGGQLITCNCKTGDLPPYKVPWVQIPFFCGLCGKTWPELFIVPDEEWEKYVVPELQKEVLCRNCFGHLKVLFPEGWKKKVDWNKER